MNGTKYEVPYCGVLRSPFVFLLGSNFRLGILFSHTLNLHSSVDIIEVNTKKVIVKMEVIMKLYFEKH